MITEFNPKSISVISSQLNIIEDNIQTLIDNIYELGEIASVACEEETFNAFNNAISRLLDRVEECKNFKHNWLDKA